MSQPPALDPGGGQADVKPCGCCGRTFRWRTDKIAHLEAVLREVEKVFGGRKSFGEGSAGKAESEPDTDVRRESRPSEAGNKAADGSEGASRSKGTPPAPSASPDVQQRQRGEEPATTTRTPRARAASTRDGGAEKHEKPADDSRNQSEPTDTKNRAEPNGGGASRGASKETTSLMADARTMSPPRSARRGDAGAQDRDAVRRGVQSRESRPGNTPSDKDKAGKGAATETKTPSPKKSAAGDATPRSRGVKRPRGASSSDESSSSSESGDGPISLTSSSDGERATSTVKRRRPSIGFKRRKFAPKKSPGPARTIKKVRQGNAGGGVPKKVRRKSNAT